jgi:competence protein ComEC
MAILAATAFVTGRSPRPLRLVALAVVILVLADPLLAWSVGFWLSVGATVGVCVLGPWLAARLPGPAWFGAALGVTLGAQAGVALPAVLVFHRLPVVSVVANLAAVPVAGFVMLYGLPAGLVAGVLPGGLRSLVMLPAVVGTRWVSIVAQTAASSEPSARWTWLCWALIAAAVAVAVRRRSRTGGGGVPI